MASIEHRTIATNGIDMHIAEAGSRPARGVVSRLSGVVVFVAPSTAGVGAMRAFTSSRRISAATDRPTRRRRSMRTRSSISSATSSDWSRRWANDRP